jgi:hypothetical protein
VNDQRSKSAWPRRLFEAGFFIALVVTMWTVDTLTKIDVFEFHQVNYDRFRLIAEQVTSAIGVLLLIPAVAWWLDRFPLNRERIASTVAGHALGIVLFGTIHHFLIVGMRMLIYPMFGRGYVFSDHWLHNVGIEIQKDVKIYLAIVAIVAVYGLYRRQQADAVNASLDRLVVQTGSGETVIRREDICFLEAARNYVVVGTSDRDYLVRDTLSNLEKTLAPDQLLRTHRSWLVNINQVDEIRPTGSGGHEVRLRGGKTVPLSRGYRDAFKARLKGTAT